MRYELRWPPFIGMYQRNRQRPNQTIFDHASGSHVRPQRPRGRYDNFLRSIQEHRTLSEAKITQSPRSNLFLYHSKNSTFSPFRTEPSLTVCTNAFFAHAARPPVLLTGGTPKRTLDRQHFCKPTDGSLTRGISIRRKDWKKYPRTSGLISVKILVCAL